VSQPTTAQLVSCVRAFELFHGKRYPRAAQELGWQFVFASRQLLRCPRTGRLGRHHVYSASL
jgi:hypothetical protein